MLLRPIPVDPNLEQVAMETMKQQQQLLQQQQQQQEAREEGWGGVERRGGRERVAEERIREGRTGQLGRRGREEGRRLETLREMWYE